jgi:DNA-binding transcriptional LysR family regulator
MARSSEPSGVLRLGTVASLSSRRIPGQLLRLHEKYPLIKVVLDSEDPLTLLEKLRHNELDILYMTSDEISGDDLVSCYERNEPLHFVAASDHPLAEKSNVTLDEILSYDLVLSERNLSILRKVTSDEKRIEPFLMTGMLNLILDTVAHSRAVSLLPDYVTEAPIRSGSIVKLPVDGIKEHLELKVVYHKNKWVTPEMEAYISLFPSD